MAPVFLSLFLPPKNKRVRKNQIIQTTPEERTMLSPCFFTAVVNDVIKIKRRIEKNNTCVHIQGCRNVCNIPCSINAADTKKKSCLVSFSNYISPRCRKKNWSRKKNHTGMLYVCINRFLHKNGFTWNEK